MIKQQIMEESNQKQSHFRLFFGAFPRVENENLTLVWNLCSEYEYFHSGNRFSILAATLGEDICGLSAEKKRLEGQKSKNLSTGSRLQVSHRIWGILGTLHQTPAGKVMDSVLIQYVLSVSVVICTQCSVWETVHCECYCIIAVQCQYDDWFTVFLYL